MLSRMGGEDNIIELGKQAVISLQAIGVKLQCFFYQIRVSEGGLDNIADLSELGIKTFPDLSSDGY